MQGSQKYEKSQDQIEAQTHFLANTESRPNVQQNAHLLCLAAMLTFQWGFPQQRYVWSRDRPFVAISPGNLLSSDFQTVKFKI